MNQKFKKIIIILVLGLFIALIALIIWMVFFGGEVTGH